MSLTEQVANQAKFMARDLTEDRQALLEVMAQAAVNSLEARLRDDVSPEDCLPDFVTAAGLYTVAALEDIGGLGGVEQFTAGDVTVRHGGSKANELRRQATAMMAQWIKPGTVFLGV